MTVTEQQLLSFVNKAKEYRHTDSTKSLDYKSEDGNHCPFEYISIAPLRLKLLLWVYKVFNYLIKEMNRDELFKTLTKRNRDVYMSLEKRFKNEEMKVIKVQKFTKENKLKKYTLMILINDNGTFKGLETIIL